jgi:RNA ligase
MNHQKYPRTWHLPSSPGATSDDKVLRDVSYFEGKEVVITLKMDGENCTAHSDGHIHARSLDSRGGEDRAWVKKFLTEQVCFHLPEGWRVCGENLWARHSIHYTSLPSYFLGFSAWDDTNTCLSWKDTIEYFSLLNIEAVPVLYEGTFNETILKSIEKNLSPEADEGYVVRLTSSFHYDDFQRSVAKWVRSNHVQTDTHWRHAAITPNQLKD